MDWRYAVIKLNMLPKPDPQWHGKYKIVTRWNDNERLTEESCNVHQQADPAGLYAVLKMPTAPLIRTARQSR